jgi:hypothetical protein
MDNLIIHGLDWIGYGLDKGSFGLDKKVRGYGYYLYYPWIEWIII